MVLTSLREIEINEENSAPKPMISFKTTVNLVRLSYEKAKAKTLDK